jgi:hypothetical protein
MAGLDLNAPAECAWLDLNFPVEQEDGECGENDGDAVGGLRSMQGSSPSR